MLQGGINSWPIAKLISHLDGPRIVQFCFVTLQGKKLPLVRDEYSCILDEWISKSTCPTRRVEFAEKKSSFLLRSEFPSISGLCKLA